MTIKLNFLQHVLFVSVIWLHSVLGFSQSEAISIEPPNWWVGMKGENVQLLVEGKSISNIHLQKSYDKVSIDNIETLENPRYHIIDLKIDAGAPPQTLYFEIQFTDGKKLNISYELLARRERDRNGITHSDAIYLITPDRFSNGDTLNDSTEDTLEKVNRNAIHGRHGGDIKGIIDHISYLKDLGVTTVWLNPILENNQKESSYHGYGISDFYKVDSRFGTNREYLELIRELQKNDIKIIMDQVFNHCGEGHRWIKDLPQSDWINHWPNYTKSNFSNITSSDPYASEYDMDLLTKGWFDRTLPDLNLKNDILRKYLIQNSIWWVETASLNGIRMDTYPYPDKNAMKEWINKIMEEYPELYIVGETWENNPSALSYWNSRFENKDGFDSGLTSISDFPLYDALIKSFGENGDIYSVYEVLAQDMVYGNPFSNKIFIGNHDVPRVATLLNNDLAKIKLAFTLLLTTRGIPQIYYGDELMFNGDRPDGTIRMDFPGGWEDDDLNLFEETERSTNQNELYNYVADLLNWRKTSREISEGDLIHFRPENNLYVYFRKLENSAIMVIINNSNKMIEDFEFNKYKEVTKGYNYAKYLLSDGNIDLISTIPVMPNSSVIVKLKK